MKKDSTSRLRFFVLFIIFICNFNFAIGQCGITLAATVTHVTCYNGTNGAIAVIATGGTAPYSFQLAEAGAGAWNATANFSGLAANIYPLSVRDFTGCVKTIYVTISQPAIFSAGYTYNNITCLGGSNGNIGIAVSGGTAPFSYAWTKNGVAFSTNQNLANIAVGNYNLIVTDARGCTVSPVVSQQVKALGITGFNEDVVANGSNASPASKTTQAFDDADGAVFYENGYTNAIGVAETPRWPAQ